MIPVGGFGGVKLAVTMGGIVTEVEIPKRIAYCSPPRYEPVGYEVRTENHKDLQFIDGYRLYFKALIENVNTGDEALMASVYDIISKSQASGIPIVLYPKWVDGSSKSYEVVCTDNFALDDVNIKMKTAQRIKELNFMSYELSEDNTE